jgi:hypothetical protein
MRDEVVLSPISDWKQIQANPAKPTAHCVVSRRYLRFSSPVDPQNGAGQVVRVEVMSESHPPFFDRKLCEVVLSVEDLRSILNAGESGVVSGQAIS